MVFYVIDRDYFSQTFANADQAEPITRGEPDRCNNCGKPISMLKWLPPYKVILDKPVYGDFVFGVFPEMLVSERFMTVYSIADLKGILAFHSVEIVEVKRKRNKDPNPPGYFKIDIVRTRTLVDETLSQFERESDALQSLCPICRIGGLKSYAGIYIKEDTWTGEDIFYPVGLSEIIVTNRFVEVADKLALTNLNAVEATDYESYWTRFEVKSRS